MKLLCTLFAAFLLTFSVAEAKKVVKKKNSRSPASAVSIATYCGILAYGQSGRDRLDFYVVVDSPARAAGSNAPTPQGITIPQDAVISPAYQPHAGDSDPGNPMYVNHNVRIGGQNVWMNYAGDFFTDSQLAHGKCICVTGEKTPETGALNYFEGYAFRDASKCDGLDRAGADEIKRNFN